tara:strand:- start:137 stop:361 length:225 start_codon:yes stop_codon:yes gene_type:complete
VACDFESDCGELFEEEGEGERPVDDDCRAGEVCVDLTIVGEVLREECEEVVCFDSDGEWDDLKGDDDFSFAGEV